MKHGLVHHIEIYVSNLDKSTEFWKWFLTEVFDYAVTQKWENGISFKMHDTYIVFVQTEKKYLEPTFHRKRTGLNHLAFHCKSKAFVDDLERKLIAKGVTILYQDKHPYAGGQHYYVVFFEDPDRIKVEVVVSSEE